MKPSKTLMEEIGRALGYPIAPRADDHAKSKPTTKPHPTDYAPYHTLPGFDRGITDYMERRYENPYTGPREGLAAQAWDRGAEYAMRVVRYSTTKE